jgi:hypothetical protein
MSDIHSGFEALRTQESKEGCTRSRVILDFIRHEKKDGAVLSKQGRLDAAERGVKYRDVNMPRVVVSSQITRSGESALLAGMGDMLSRDEILDYSDFSALKGMIDKKHGLPKPISKSYIDTRLGFDYPDSEVKKRAYAAAGENKFLKWAVEDSNKLEGTATVKGNSSYDSTSANVAGLVLKYVKVSNNFDRLVEAGNVDTHDIHRILGSHNGVVDVFLAKLIELMKGVAERDKFVSASEGSGFGFLEGFRMEIVHDNTGALSIKVDYDKQNSKDETVFSFHEQVPLEILERIAGKIQ